MKRTGLTLIEIIAAMLLFATGALGLAATSAIITRQMNADLARSRSAAFARERSEKAHAAGCGAFSGGTESREGISASWTVAGINAVSMDQQLERSSMRSLQSDRFLSAVPCS
jgi:Tfp pilus assembly protein PilV